MELKETKPEICALLQGQGDFFNPNELFLYIKNLEKFSPTESVEVVMISDNELSKRKICKIKEIIESSIIKVEIENIGEFQIMLTLEENGKEYKSNMVRFTNHQNNFFFTIINFDVALMEIQKIWKRFEKDVEKRTAAITALNRAYQSQFEDGNSIFHDAIMCDKFSDIKSIAKGNSNLLNELKNIFGESVLHYACRINKHASIETLLELDCSLSQQDHSKSTPLHLALEYEAYNTVGVFEKILKNAKFPEQVVKALKVYNLKGHTPLHLAVLSNQQDLVVAIIRFCKAQKQLDICRMEVLGAGARILHLAASKKLDQLWQTIVQEMPESLHWTDYAGRTSKRKTFPKILEKPCHSGRGNEPYPKAERPRREDSLNVNKKCNVVKDFSKLRIR